MAAADTNVILRLLLRDDEQQYLDAKRFLDTNEHVFVSHVVLAEVAWVLASAYRVPKEKICDAIAMLVEVPAFRLEGAPLVQAALAEYRAANADFSDCLVLAAARAANELPLATFDANFARLNGTTKLGRSPRKKR